VVARTARFFEVLFVYRTISSSSPEQIDHSATSENQKHQTNDKADERTCRESFFLSDLVLSEFRLELRSRAALFHRLDSCVANRMLHLHDSCTYIVIGFAYSCDWSHEAVLTAFIQMVERSAGFSIVRGEESGDALLCGAEPQAVTGECFPETLLIVCVRRYRTIATGSFGDDKFVKVIGLIEYKFAS